MTNDLASEEPLEEPTTTQGFYEQWQADPTPDNLGRVVKSLDTAIGYKLTSMGVGNNPQMRNQARLYAAEAVKKYNPSSGASLPTWTQSQLQSLQRYKRESQGPVKIPDRAAIDGWRIEKVRRELEDELGVEPDVKQIADRSGLSVKRIATVNKITRPVAASEQMYTEGEELPDFMGEALEYIYDESDRTDRKIIEMLTGYGGTRIRSKKEIAEKLGISASQVTRRSERIGVKLQDMEQMINKTHA